MPVFDRDPVLGFPVLIPAEERVLLVGIDDDDVVILPRLFDRQAQSWDCTFKSTDTSDFVSGQVWGKKKVDYYLLDRHNQRMGIIDTMKAIEAMTRRWPLARAKYIEDKANGTAVIEMLEKRINGIIPIEPSGGKEVRANAISPIWESGNVYLPHPLYRPWVDDFVEQVISFPNAANDDDVDAMTQLLNQMDGGSSLLERYGVQ